MTKKDRPVRPKAALPRGLRDLAGEEVRALGRMIACVSDVFEQRGFDPLSTPAFEFTEALGKFLPDLDRPNEGVFSLRDDDERWLSLRYDLTAPLARYVAENFETVPKPFRRYQWGTVWRNEKPGPGRFREFTQIDADTVGTASPSADAEMAMIAADCMEALEIPRGQYVIRVNNRKLMDGVLERLGLADGDQTSAGTRPVVMRSVDKLDRLGADGVRALLGAGREDESGAFTKGAGLTADQIDIVMAFTEAGAGDRAATLGSLAEVAGGTEAGDAGLEELKAIDGLLDAAGYDQSRVAFDPSVVRGLDYYTGPVLEAELTFSAAGEDGTVSRFGSVGGGGRYDGLVARFRGEAVPATGFSIGVSRLYAALEALGRHEANRIAPPVVVLVMDRDEVPRYEAMARELREAGLRAEMYMGTSGMKAQMKYADRRGAPAVIIEGSDEREQNQITIKDLAEGTRMSQSIEGRDEWRAARPAQQTVPRGELVTCVGEILSAQGYGLRGRG